jgi:hypothetical protein
MAFRYMRGRFMRMRRTDDTKYMPIIQAMNKTSMFE